MPEDRPTLVPGEPLLSRIMGFVTGVILERLTFESEERPADELIAGA